jgi:hypothetical protein
MAFGIETAILSFAMGLVLAIPFAVAALARTSKRVAYG